MSKIMTGVDESSQSMHMTTDTAPMTERVLHVESSPQSHEERELFGSPIVSDDDMSSIASDIQQESEEEKEEEEEEEDSDGGLNFNFAKKYRNTLMHLPRYPL